MTAPRRLHSGDFPTGTPLNRFFLWNERARRRDRRYVIACDLYRLMTAVGGDDVGYRAAVAHLSLQPMTIAGRPANRVSMRNEVASIPDPRSGDVSGRDLAVAARQTVERLAASIGSANIDAHAALFDAFERLADQINLDALARRRPKIAPSRRRPSPRRILVIRLSALGDFVQALGPAAAIRRHHSTDHITLLTTSVFADFARRLGFFDEVAVDRRPAAADVSGWLELRRRLRRGSFDRVYDLQTSQRSAAYARLFHPGPLPEWSGIARGCSHRHAYLDRDRQHTIDKQAEQLLMAGIHPTPLPTLPSFAGAMPTGLVDRRFVVMVPGSSPRHPAKRWPARRYGMLAEALRRAGYPSVIIGSAAERALATAIQAICAEAIDLTGQTDLAAVAALAERAALTVGNDTGVMHLAAAAGCPLVVLFSGVSDPALCGPRGRRVRVLAVSNLAGLEVDQVLAEALSTIAERTRPAVSPATEPTTAASEAAG